MLTACEAPRAALGGGGEEAAAERWAVRTGGWDHLAMRSKKLEPGLSLSPAGTVMAVA